MLSPNRSERQSTILKIPNCIIHVIYSNTSIDCSISSSEKIFTVLASYREFHVEATKNVEKNILFSFFLLLYYMDSISK